VLLPALLFGLTAWACLLAAWQFDAIATLSIASAVLIGMLLSSERHHWLPAVAAAWIANTLANVAVGFGPALAGALALANSVEVSLVLWLLGGRIKGPMDLIQARVLARFFGAVLLAAAASALLGSGFMHLALGAPLAATARRWYAADLLGMAVVVPLVLALRPAELLDVLRSQRWYHSAIPLLLLITTTVLLFSQSNYPLLIVVLPPLLLVTFRLGFAGTAVGIFLVVVIVIGFSLAGTGPFMAWPQGSAVTRIVAIQLFTAIMILLTYPVSAMIAAQGKLLGEVAESERRFRLIAEHSSDLVGMVDADGIWRYASPSAVNLFGWQPQEIVGTDGTAFVHHDDVAGFRGGIKLLAGGQEVLKGVFRVRHRDGHYVWVETICQLVRDAAGVPSGWVSNSRDISSRKRIEQIKDEFISTVNHELRTPLTAMTASVGLALSGRFGQVSTPMRRLLEMARANGERLATMVNDILDFEKVSSGKMSFKLRPHPVDALVEQAVNANRAYAMQFEVTLQMRCRVPGVSINVDADRFQQVMSNLLSNAAKFSKRGGQVEVDVMVDTGRCRISVIDHGCGIPATFRSSLFERFAQADASDRRTQGGTGLGMAIAKRLVEGMAGSISYETEEDRGTTFHLDFAVTTSANSPEAS
jgi:PAS domain S-box-containing protein